MSMSVATARKWHLGRLAAQSLFVGMGVVWGVSQLSGATVGSTRKVGWSVPRADECKKWRGPGVPTPDSTLSDQVPRDPVTQSRIDRHEVCVGMTAASVHLAWGLPRIIRATITDDTTVDRYEYDGAEVVLVDGIVEEVHERKGRQGGKLRRRV